METADRHEDISDEVWQLLESRLPERKGAWGGNAHDNRTFVNGVFWILRTGAAWRDLPAEYGSWKNAHRRFCRWRDRGIWEIILELLVEIPDYKWLILADYRDMSRKIAGSTPRYIWPWMRMICRSERLLQKAPRLVMYARRPIAD
jgi:transposase